MNIQNIIYSINWSAPSWDLFVVVVFVAGIFLYSLSLGRDKVLVLLISSYVSLVFVGKSSFLLAQLGIQFEGSFINYFAIFIGGILILFFIISNSALTSIFDQGPRGAWFQTIIISFLQIGFMISVAVSFMSPEEVNMLSSSMKYFFVENQAQFFWLVAPILSMLIFKK